jgi:NADH-quinone oxidoreductase subunit J
MPSQALLFYAFGALALIGAFAVLLQARNLVAAVTALLVTTVSLAGIFVLLEAHLVAVLQLLVQTGSLLVLLIFVVMLVAPGGEDFGPEDPGRMIVKIAGVVVALALGIGLVAAVRDGLPLPPVPPAGFGGFRAIGRELFTAYLVPMEALALLLLAALVGALLLLRRRHE